MCATAAPSKTGLSDSSTKPASTKKPARADPASENIAPNNIASKNAASKNTESKNTESKNAESKNTESKNTATAALTLEQASLPVIDLEGLFTGDESGVANALGDAARTSGFFYITGHRIEQSLIDALFAASEQFHSMPRAWKMKYWCGFTNNHRGYVPFEENGRNFPSKINYHEAWDMSYEVAADHPDYLAGWRMTGPNVWPDLPGWQDTVTAYYNAVFELGLRILDALALNLGVEKQELRQHIVNPTSQLRMLRYLENDAPADESAVGIDSHSDFEAFTILLQGGPGLQVMNADDYWVEAPPIPGTFIVNIGDIFEAWSAGRFKATQHRVVNTGRARYSFPLFFGLNYHSVVQPLRKFATEETLKRYPPMVAGEHLMQMSVHGFRYLQDGVDKGTINLGYEVPAENPFMREAKPIDG
jgi:isopenicillin N synthase-like dioxygenase